MMNAKPLNAKEVFALLKETYTEWSNDRCFRLAAALAYYSIFSIAPLVLITIGLVGAIYGQDAAQGQVSEQLGKVMGPQVAKSIEEMVVSAGQHSKGATIVGFVTLLVGASGVFGQLKDALNTIWEVKPKPGLGVMGFVKSRVLTFGIVLVIGFLMLVSLLLSTLLAAFSGFIEQSFGIPPFISGALGFIVPFAVEVLLFAMLFKFLPDAQVRWSNVWIGAVVTALLFEIGKSLLSWYLGRASTTSSFGAAGSLVLVLLWVYYNSLILFFGAEFTEVYARATGCVIQPKSNAVSIRACEREEQGMVGFAEDGSTKGQAAGTPYVEAESEPSPLHPDRETPSRPRKERLYQLRAEESLYDLDMGEPTIAEIRPKPTLLERVHGHPLAEVGTALGVGLLLGAVSRIAGERREMGAAEHLKLGGKALGLAALAMLTRAGVNVRERLEPEKVRRTAHRAAEQVRQLSEEIPDRVSSVLSK